MPSPRPNTFRVLLAKEIRDFLRSWAFWGMLLILSLLVGYSFIQAATLFAEASRSAPPGSDLARGLSPLDGIIVPTFGAYYLVLTLLFPFLAIRALGAEKQSGSVKLLLQMPVSPVSAIAVKAASLLIAWLSALLPGLCAIAAWRFLGGNVGWAETLNLLLGYSLYAFAVIGVCLSASAAADTVSASALAALAVILSSWVLDFSVGAGSSWPSALEPLSLTAALRPFERGLFLLGGAARLLIIGLGGMALAAALVRPAGLSRKLHDAALIVLVAILAGLFTASVRFSRDVSEDRRNSFSPSTERALTALDKPLRITVHLSLEDSRFQDLERNILGKLRRAVPRLRVAVDSGPDYGWVTYEYAGRSDRSTSNSEEEVLPLIFKLAGRQAPQGAAPDYMGYPLTRGAGSSGIWFYLVLPALFCLGAVLSRRECASEIKGGNEK